MSSDTSVSRSQTNMMFRNYSSLRVPPERSEGKQVPGNNTSLGSSGKAEFTVVGGVEALFSKPSF